MKALRAQLAELGLVLRGDDAAWAAYSPCERYRYALGRSWEPLLGGPVVLWVLHNPSTATELAVDPTLRRCVDFSKREGAGGLIFTNVMAWRSTDKDALRFVDDPVGPLNPVAIERCIAAADRVVLAWGKIDPRLGVAARLEAVDGQAQCLGKNGDGSPRHPLYLAGGTPLLPWSGDM